MKQKITLLTLLLMLSACAANFFVAPSPAPISVQFCRQINVDSRVTWLKIDCSVQLPRYEITDIAFQDETQSGGNINVYVSVLDELGRPAFGTRVRWNTVDGQNEAIQTTINGSTDFPMSGDSSFDPARGESGPYFLEIAGVASDRVTGFGLRLRRHESYQVRFQKKVSGAVTPIPGNTVTPGGNTITFPLANCDFLAKSGIYLCRP